METNNRQSYLKAFQHVAKTCPDAFKLIGQGLLVEEVHQPELKSASGLILAASTNVRQIDSIADSKPMEVRVLLVGEGFYDDETGEDSPLETKPGDILLVGKLSVKWLSSIAGVFIQEGGVKVGLVNESEDQFHYNGQEGYNRFGAELTQGMQIK